MFSRKPKLSPGRRALNSLAAAVESGRAADYETIEAYLEPLITPEVVRCLKDSDRSELFSRYHEWSKQRPNRAQAGKDLIQFGEMVLSAGVTPDVGLAIHTCLASTAQVLYLPMNEAVYKDLALWEKPFIHLRKASECVNHLKKPLAAPCLDSIYRALQCLAVLASSCSRPPNDPRARTSLEHWCKNCSDLFAVALQNSGVSDEKVLAMHTLCTALTLREKPPSKDYCTKLSTAIDVLADHSKSEPFPNSTQIIESGLKVLLYLQTEANNHEAACETSYKLYQLFANDSANYAKAEKYLVDALEHGLSAKHEIWSDRITIELISIDERRHLTLNAKLRLFCARPFLAEEGPLSRTSIVNAMASGIISGEAPSNELATSVAEQLFRLDKLKTISFLANFYHLREGESDRSDITSLVETLLSNYEKTRPTAAEIVSLAKGAKELPATSYIQLGLILSRALLDEGDTARASNLAGALLEKAEQNSFQANECKTVLAAAHLTNNELSEAAEITTGMINCGLILGFLSSAISCYSHSTSDPKLAARYYELARSQMKALGGKDKYPPLQGIDSISSLCKMVEDGVKNRTLHRWHMHRH